MIRFFKLDNNKFIFLNKTYNFFLIKYNLYEEVWLRIDWQEVNIITFMPALLMFFYIFIAYLVTHKKLRDRIYARTLGKYIEHMLVKDVPFIVPGWPQFITRTTGFIMRDKFTFIYININIYVLSLFAFYYWTSRNTIALFDFDLNYLFFFEKFTILLSKLSPVSYNFFTLFWLNFILCTIVSISFYTSLGLNGLFFLNGLGLILFWLSLLISFNKFIVYGYEYTFILGDFSILSNCHNLTISFFIDKVSYSFAFLTTSIAVFVYLFSFCYFRYEPNIERLVTLLLLFVNSMILLVFSGNLIMLFLGWELIGITSFFLINFWSMRVSTLKSAFKALVFNRFSDSFILIAIVLVYNIFNTTDIVTICNSVYLYNNTFMDLSLFNFKLKIRIIEIICWFFMLAAFIKSAQIGFHLWLPDSMEAPAPASALIHSATLVSAGIFLILRLSPFFELSNCGQNIIPVIGAITSFYGGVVSSAQTDLKRILAYSTISHCGFMMLLASTFNVDLTLLYLYIHGFFKALLFLASGNIMRFFKSQDFRYMGGAYKYLPLECMICIFSFWHLSGGPFSYGYISKHYIITSLTGNNITSIFIYTNLLLSILSSIIYSYRFIYFVFFDFKKSKKSIYNSYSSLQLSSLHFSISTRAGILIIFINYIFVLIASSYVVSLWSPFLITSSTENNIHFSINNILSQELSIYGISIISPVILINTIAFLFFWANIFITFRSTIYFEQDILTMFFALFTIFTFIFVSTNSLFDLVVTYTFSLGYTFFYYIAVYIPKVFFNFIYLIFTSILPAKFFAISLNDLYYFFTVCLPTAITTGTLSHHPKG